MSTESEHKTVKRRIVRRRTRRYDPESENGLIVSLAFILFVIAVFVVLALATGAANNKSPVPIP